MEALAASLQKSAAAVDSRALLKLRVEMLPFFLREAFRNVTWKDFETQMRTHNLICFSGKPSDPLACFYRFYL